MNTYRKLLWIEIHYNRLWLLRPLEFLNICLCALDYQMQHKVFRGLWDEVLRDLKCFVYLDDVLVAYANERSI